MSNPHAAGSNAESAPADPATQNRATKTAPRRLWVTAVLLAALVVTVNAWTTRHLGWGLENAFGITTTAAGLALVATLAEKLLPEDELGRLRISLAKIPLALVLALWIVFGAIAATRSSVVVLRDPRAESLSNEGVILSRVDSGTVIQPAARSSKDDPVRFEIPTTPFGHTYRLKVSGYIEQVITVYPLVGLTVIPERDLHVSPSVLFRPPTNALQELDPKSGGKFQVLLLDGGSSQSLMVSCQKSSFLLGTDQEIPAAWPELWKLELEVPGVTAVSSMTAATLLAWHRYTLLQPPRDLAPGAVLEARVVSGGNDVIASARVTLRAEALIDVPLLAETSPRPLSPKEVSACPAK